MIIRQSLYTGGSVKTYDFLNNWIRNGGFYAKSRDGWSQPQPIGIFLNFKLELLK